MAPSGERPASAALPTQGPSGSAACEPPSHATGKGGTSFLCRLPAHQPEPEPLGPSPPETSPELRLGALDFLFVPVG